MSTVVEFCAHCDRDHQDELFEPHWILNCRCHEQQNPILEWRWHPPDGPANAFRLSESDSVITFHPLESRGTVIVRGTKILSNGVYFWELKAISPLYGTDVMIGVGLTNTNTSRFASDFCSALGLSTTTWGLSYRGNLMHAGVETAVPSAAFKRGAIVGCLLNLWYRTLQFYLDGKLIREACFTDLPPGSYYPMVCSTALRSGFRLIRAESYPISLQILCCHALCKAAAKQNSLDILANSNIPGLLKEIFQTKLPWSLYLGTATKEEPTRLTSTVRPSSHAVLTSNTRGVAYVPLNQDENDSSGECDPFLWTTFSDDESRVSSSGSLCLLDQLDSELEDASPFSDMYRLDMHNTESSNSDYMADDYGPYDT